MRPDLVSARLTRAVEIERHAEGPAIALRGRPLNARSEVQVDILAKEWTESRVIELALKLETSWKWPRAQANETSGILQRTLRYDLASLKADSVHTHPNYSVTESYQKRLLSTRALVARIDG